MIKELRNIMFSPPDITQEESIDNCSSKIGMVGLQQDLRLKNLKETLQTI